MLPLTASEIAEFRTTFNATLLYTGTIYRATRAADGSGGSTETESSQGNFSCRLETAGKQPGVTMLAITMADRLANREVFVVYFPYNTNVQDGDRITIGSRSFRVVAVLYDEMQVSRRAVVVRIV